MNQRKEMLLLPKYLFYEPKNGVLGRIAHPLIILITNYLLTVLHVSFGLLISDPTIICWARS